VPIVVGGTVAPTPFVPTWVNPVNASYADLAGEPTAGCVVEWIYNPAVAGNTQTGYAMRAKISGAASYVFWNASVNAWQTGQVINASTLQDVSLPAGAFQDGVVYNLGLATRDANGLGAYTPDITVTATAGPTVTVTAPAGTIATALPEIVWVPGLPVPSIPVPPWHAREPYTLGEEVQPAPSNGFVYRCTTAGTTGATHPTWPTTLGGTVTDGTVHWAATQPFAPSGSTVTPQQTSYRAVIFTAAQYGIGGFDPNVSPNTFDTGQVPSGFDSSVVDTAYLATGVTYRVYVQITETGGAASNWAYSTFTTSYTPPVTPTFTAVPGVDSNGAPITTLTTTGHQTGGYTSGVFVNLQYSDDGGTTWFPVRGGSAVPLPAGQVVTVVDTEVPPGFTRHYQVILTQ
jgi:hypothetical protein